MIFDPIRGKFVAATPEEEVRQRVICQMLGLGYPKSLIAVEKDLASLAHLHADADPCRRVDLLCFSPFEQCGLRPLLIVECKVEMQGGGAERQLAGYNTLIGAPFFALADAKGIQTFWFENKRCASIRFLPSYQQLVETCCVT